MSTHDKYLIFDTVNCWPAGLDHKLNTLKCVIEEAIHLDRILVLRKFAICPYQNFIYKTNSKIKTVNTSMMISDIYISQDIRDGLQYRNFEDYINLEKTKIYKPENNGDIQEIEKTFRYINEENFDLSAYTDEPELVLNTSKLADEFVNNEPKAFNNQILIMVNREALSTEQNNQYKVVVRRTNIHGYKVVKENRFLVKFSPSDKVEHLTDKILRSMGTSLISAKKRATFYRGATTREIQNNYQIEFSQKYPLYYACLHVRLGDAAHYMHIKYASAPHHLRHIVSCAVPKGSTIYIMSDISDPCYFDFLKKNYTVYLYSDFPELKALALAENDRGVDNAMLYSVEKNIMQYAYIKITRTKREPKTLYINSSLSIPKKYKLFRLYEYLTTDLPQIIKYFKLSIRKIRNDVIHIIRSREAQL